MPPYPHHLVSVFPTQHPTNTYHTLISHSGEGWAGLDHILTAAEHIEPTCTCDIGHEIAPAYLSSDYYSIYTTFALACPNTAPTPPTTKLYHYRKVTKIPFVNTYPTPSNNFTPPWFAQRTLGILPTDVSAHAKINQSLALVHDHPQVQHHLKQASQNLTDLDTHTTTLYLAHYTSTPTYQAEDLIPRTPLSRRLVNNTSASWQRGIEQMMTNAKLFTVRTPNQNKHTHTKRKSKRAQRTQWDTDRVTYRDTFNMINSTLVIHSILSKTLKESNLTIFTINRTHLALLNNIMHDIINKHKSLRHDVYTLERQLQEQYDTRIIQTTEYGRHHTIPDAEK